MTALNSGLWRIAAAILFACTCGCYPTQYVYRQVERQVVVPQTQTHTPKRLTREMIQYFKINREELLKLKFYLENALILQEVCHVGKSSVTAEGELDLKRIIVQDEIVFKHMTEGRAVEVRDYGPFWRQNPIFVIWVEFNDSAKNATSPPKSFSLKFVPNIWGEYEVDKTPWTNKVSYQGRRYQSLLSGVDNFLLVDTHLFEEIIHRRRIVAGIKSGR